MTKAHELKHLVFDLDDTLIDTTGLIIPIAVRETASAMIASGLKANAEEIARFRIELLRSSPQLDFVEAAVQKFGVNGDSTAVLKAGHSTFYHATEARLMALKDSDHSRQALRFVEDFNGKYQIHIVTSGEEETQLRKIRYSGLDRMTSSIRCVSAHERGAKGSVFLDLMRAQHSPPASFLSIGNRLDIEIAEAKALGWTTCWFRHGEYRDMIPKSPLEQPDFAVASWSELKRIL